MRKQRAGGRNDTQIIVKGQNTPWPEDARPNPYLSETFDNFSERMTASRKVDASAKGVGGMCLHAKKQIVATGGDDCNWSIWNLDNQEMIMSG